MRADRKISSLSPQRGRFSNRALMSSSYGLWHIVGRVLAWATLLFAVGAGRIQPLQALVGRCEFSGLEISAIGRGCVKTIQQPLILGQNLINE